MTAPTIKASHRGLLKGSLGGLGALSTLALGQTIALAPAEAHAASSRKLVGQRQARRRTNDNGRLKNDYSRATLIKSVGLNCRTVCGIQGYVIDGQLVKVGGNPEDPNNGKSLCAKGQSGPEINTYADRLLYPLERVGPRGSGQWRRIGWDEALDRVAGRIRKTIAEGHPEETAVHIGRSDEWWAPNPGSEGAIALAMGHAIMAAGGADRAFLDD